MELEHEEWKRILWCAGWWPQPASHLHPEAAVRGGGGGSGGGGGGVGVFQGLCKRAIPTICIIAYRCSYALQGFSSAYRIAYMGWTEEFVVHVPYM